MDGTTQGIIAVIIGMILFVMGYYKGRHHGAATALDALISLRLLKVNPDGNIVRGDKLDLE